MFFQICTNLTCIGSLNLTKLGGSIQPIRIMINIHQTHFWTKIV